MTKLNYNIPNIPERPDKPRDVGLTMVMDKGLSLTQTEALIESAGEYIDLIKLGFGTSLITNNLDDKLNLYREAGIRPYLGGTLFEAFLIRNCFDDFRKFIAQHHLDLIEISDGSMAIPHEEKQEYIRIMNEEVTVLSEVGSKQAGIVIPPDQWIRMIKDEFEAGVWKVITEARESGNVGIFNKDGSADSDLIDDIIGEVNPDNILWEAPVKNQQVWFIKLLGSNVNLGNIAVQDVIPLETLRLGLRGDTFLDFLPEELVK